MDKRVHDWIFIACDVTWQTDVTGIARGQDACMDIMHR